MLQQTHSSTQSEHSYKGNCWVKNICVGNFDTLRFLPCKQASAISNFLQKFQVSFNRVSQSLAELGAHTRSLNICQWKGCLPSPCSPFLFLTLPITLKSLGVKSIPVLHHFVSGNFFPELSQFCWACAR